MPLNQVLVLVLVSSQDLCLETKTKILMSGLKTQTKNLVGSRHPDLDARSYGWNQDLCKLVTNSLKTQDLVFASLHGTPVRFWTWTYKPQADCVLLEQVCLCDACSSMTSTYPMCLSICLSQPAVASKWANGSNCFLAQRLPLTCLTLRYMEIQVPPKIHFSGTLSKTLDFKKLSCPIDHCQLSSAKKHCQFLTLCLMQWLWCSTSLSAAAETCVYACTSCLLVYILPKN